MSGVDMGPLSQPSGILSHMKGNSKRAWDLLTVARFELWNKAMDRRTNPNMSQADILDVGKKLAGWANHATGSAKNPLPGSQYYMFGPKLTASRLARIFSDPIETVKTFSDWKNASAGDKALAWERLSGAAQFFGTGLGFLAANYGLNKALGVQDKDNVNYSNPTRSDWMQFKVAGINIGIPGLHSEIKFLANIAATAFADSKQLRGESKEGHLHGVIGGYLMNKASPGLSLSTETLMQQNWKGQPLPWSKDAGKGARTRMTWLEYAAEHGPIPLQGPIGYVYDHLKKGGASSMDALAAIRGLIISGLGVTGIHAKEEQAPVPKTISRTHARAH